MCIQRLLPALLRALSGRAIPRPGSLPRIALVLVGILVVSTAGAAVFVRAPFGSNMVIQRDKPFSIRGTAATNRVITVTYNSQTNSTVSDSQGRWVITLPPMSAVPDGSTFAISEAGGNTMTLVNVVVGDVWLCSGQSNMEMALSSCNRAVDVSTANWPGIRHFRVNASVAATPMTNVAGSWTVCSPSTAGGFSATAFYFGRKLYQDLGTNVPIGLIASTVGGTCIDPWLAPEGCVDIPALAPLFSQPIANYGPFSLFNGMIHPFAGYPIKGAIWYQGENGETTVQNTDSYFLKMKALSEGWKRFFGVDALPLYYVQIANYGTIPTTATPVLFSGAWSADTRLQQANAMAIPRAGMASAIDIGETADMHPKDKLDVGERLALWALKNDYGSNLVASGPILRDAAVSGNKVICVFDHVGSGLMAGYKQPYQPTRETNAPLARFSIAGDGAWYWATATIVGDTVELTSTNVSSPKKIAYGCWQNPLGVNLYNREGLPASPFYLDDLVNKFTVTAAAGAGGAVHPSGASAYPKRKPATYTIVPEPGYYILDVAVDGSSVGAVSTYTFDPLKTNHTISAAFTNQLPAHSVHATAGPGGSISPQGVVTVPQGGSQTFTVTPNPGCTFMLLVDGRPMGLRNSFTFTDARANHTISATFSCTLKSTAGIGGSIVPSGTIVVPGGATQTYTVTPGEFYRIGDVTVDGVSLGSISTYTFTNIDSSHTIAAGFLLRPPTLTITNNASGGLDIIWPDVYAAELLCSPVPGPEAVWTPAVGTRIDAGSFYRFSVTPNSNAMFYGLGPY